MRPPFSSSLLLTTLLPLAALPQTAHAVFRDEVNHIDYHHLLLGLPQRETTFFHRPRPEDRASLLYTLSDVGVVGAVNPGNGEVLWRQYLKDSVLSSRGGHHPGDGDEGGDNNHDKEDGVVGSVVGFLRAGEDEGWVVSGYGAAVHAWDAISGRNRFWVELGGRVRDLEVMEMTESGPGRKDVLVLFEEEEGAEELGGERGATVLKRLSAEDGSVVWEHREVTRDVPLQVSTNVEKVFVVSLKGAPGAYNLKVSVLDTLTGRKLDEMVIGAKADVHGKEDVMFVGANSAAPVVAWTDDARKTLRVNVLGTKTRQEFPLSEGTVAVEIHAPHLVQSRPHFLVHSRTATAHRGEVFHIDLKTNTISKAYTLPMLPGPGAFSTSSNGANVYFTRITEDEVILLSSQSHGVLGHWPLKGTDMGAAALHGVSEVIKKAGEEESYAVRAAAVTDADDWVLIRNGEVAWTRPEGMTGGVAATFAEIPESEDLAKTLEQEAHSNLLHAYIHRVKRHINDLRYLPAWLEGLPSRLRSSILGTEVPSGKLVRDAFGFHKLVILATKRGMLYGLDAGNHGVIAWSKRAFRIPKGRNWDVKGIQVHDSTGHVTILGANNDFVVLKADTGDVVEAKGPSPESTTQGTALIDTYSGQQKLLRIGRGGKIGELPVHVAPRTTVVTRGADGELKGVVFVPNGTSSFESTSWTFNPPQGQSIVDIASRPPHDPVASIGRVLGDRRVKYKYLNPNTLVVAAVHDSSRTLTVYLLDTVSGQILSSSKYDGVDLAKPIECAMAENWFVCTYFGQYAVHDNSAQTIKGYQMVVSDLYESHEPNNRGPLGDAATFSSFDPIDIPTGGVTRPSMVSQSYVLSGPVSALQVTQTRQGITSRHVLAYLPESHGIVGIPRAVLEPRRPVGRDPTPAEAEEGLMKYHPAIEIDPKSVITHERDVLGVKKIVTAPAVVESTSLVFAYGIDVFGTRVAPSFLFDILGKGFNKLSLVGTVAALALGVVVLAPMVSFSLSCAMCDAVKREKCFADDEAGEEKTDQHEVAGAVVG
jgi:outer membrane protein assembly factor BamB